MLLPERRQNMFRKVDLPEDIPGTLYLHSMPGRMEELEDFLSEAKSQGIDTVVQNHCHSDALCVHH